MAINRRKKTAYGFGQPLVSTSPEPIISSRYPTTRDKVESGTLWIQQTDLGSGSFAYSTYVSSDTKSNEGKWRILSSDPIKKEVASPTSTVDIGSNRGSATFTGYTTAAAAVQLLTITNDWIEVGSPILISVQNAGTNDAQMTITQVETKDGSVEVVLTNNGAQALNGNIVISFDAMLS